MSSRPQPENPFSLRGETAIVTGGATGLGFGVATALVHAGARVVLVGRRETALQEAAATLGRETIYEVQDITEPGSAPRLIHRVEERAGPVSILINNAGNHVKKPARETTREDFLAILDTHVLAAFELTKAVVGGMVERQHGSIIFMASMTSIIGQPKVVAYSAAKSAYLGIVRTLSSELSASGVRVNAIAPGWIDSPMLHRALAGDEDRKRRILTRTPMARFGRPEDIGWAAVYLSSPAAQFITGVLLPVDGGASIGF